MKRSVQIGLSAAGVLLVAGIVSTRHDSSDETLVYEDPAACRADGKLNDAECTERFEEARTLRNREVKRFGGIGDCEAEYGLGRCESEVWNGTQVVVPALAGVMLARSLWKPAMLEPLLPPTRQACPPDSPRAECQPSRSSSGGGGSGPSSRSSGSRAYTTTSGQPVVAAGGATRGSIASRGGFGSTGHAFGSSSS
jgi:uncharacterized protein YgiB involved in biofilm formation